MSEFSLDDILDKYGKKDKSQTSDIDAEDILKDILGEQSRSDDQIKRRRELRTSELTFGRSAGADNTEKQEQKPLELEDPKHYEQREKERRKLAEIEAAAKAEEERIQAEEKKRAEEAKKLRIAAEEEKKRREAENQRRVAEEMKRREEERERREAEAKAAAELAEKQRQEAERKESERNAEIQKLIDEKNARSQKKLDEDKKKLEEEKKKLEREEKRRADSENSKRRQAAEAAAAATSESERRRIEEREEKRRKKADEDMERRLATKSILVQDVPIEMPAVTDTAEQERLSADAEPTTAELELEKTLRKQKIEIDAQKLLIKETELEDPDDFLTAMNPYDMSKTAGFTEQIETISAEQLAGDTKLMDPEAIKALAQDPPDDTRTITRIVDGSTRVMPDIDVNGRGEGFDPDKTFELADDIKEFIPKNHDTKEVRKRSEEEERLIQTINKTLEQNRIEDMKGTDPTSAYDTGPFDKIVIPTRSVKVDTEGGSVLRTGEIPMSDPVAAEQKLKEMNAKRKRRLSNFVLEDISDNDIDFDDDSDELTEEEDFAGIWTDLVETNKSLRVRFVLLFIVTMGLIAANVLQKMFIQQKIGFFGNELGFLSNDGIVFANLICGVIGMVICSSVIRTGIEKLFKNRSDCDSVCAVSCVFSLLAAILQLVDTNDLQQERAFLYVPVALLGLLFNSFGKLSMITRAKKNYRFISSESTKYYAEVIDGQSEASAFTKGTLSELPYLVTMRKTELLTDFLKKSYCEDMADRVARRLVPISVGVGLLLGLLVYFIPTGVKINGVNVFDTNMYWASSVAVGAICAMAPFSMMFMVNNPFRRATHKTLKHGSTLLGYTSAEEFSEANSVLVDASTLFPKSAVEVTNIKPCKLQNSINSVSLDQAIILAASLAIKSGSVMSGLFFDMIGGNKDMIADIDGCVYEDNMGVMGWYGAKRIIMGSREHMKHHSIKIPEMSAIAKYSRNGSDSVYLAVGGELAVIFFIRLTANPTVKSTIRELTNRGVSVILKTTDSLITPGRITDLFDIEPEKFRIIGSALHDLYNECTKYTAGGCGALSCSGSFVSLAKGINASKKLIKDVALSRNVTLAGTVLGVLIMIFMAFTANTLAFIPEVIMAWQTAWLLLMLGLQSLRRY